MKTGSVVGDGTVKVPSKGSLSSFRKIAIAEGVSFLVLLLVAMPLKYLAHWPLGVTIMGGIHGLLFIAFVVMAFETKKEYKLGLGWLAKALLASVLPAGTFVMDRHWRALDAGRR